MLVLTLKDALEAWQQPTPLQDKRHLSARGLRGLADAREDEAAFTHLARCQVCRERLRSLDYVRPLAADAGLPQVTAWTTAGGKYRLELRRLVHAPQQAVLVVKSSLAAGTTLVVEDAQGNEILRGEVDSAGQVAAPIADVTALALQELIVSEA